MKAEKLFSKLIGTGVSAIKLTMGKNRYVVQPFIDGHLAHDTYDGPSIESAMKECFDTRRYRLKNLLSPSAKQY